MPRDLTDLMEAATRTAPPEPHAASDITRLAATRHRRRTTSIAAAASVAVIAAGLAGYGATRGHATTPEPAAPYKLDQTVDLSSAVPASTLPGYREEPWTLPSVQHLGPGLGPLPTYREIDSQGRLIVGDAPTGDPRDAFRSRLFDGPGQAPQPLLQPPSPGVNSGHQIAWVPSFLDGRLLWTPDTPIVDSGKAGFHLTDLDGGNDVFVHSELRAGNATNDATPSPNHAWVSGDHIWFLAYDSGTIKGNSYSLYTASFSGEVTKVADEVAAAAVADGTVVWVTTDGHLATESAAGGPQHSIDVPLSEGCHLPSTVVIQNASGEHYLAVNHSVIALTEACGTARQPLGDLLAFDLAGHALVHVTGVYAVSPALGEDDLVFRGLVPPGLERSETFRYDLVTGTLVGLGPVGKVRSLQEPRAAGDYVLWYDAKGGHVGEFTD